MDAARGHLPGKRKGCIDNSAYSFPGSFDGNVLGMIRVIGAIMDMRGYELAITANVSERPYVDIGRNVAVIAAQCSTARTPAHTPAPQITLTCKKDSPIVTSTNRNF